MTIKYACDNCGEMFDDVRLLRKVEIRSAVLPGTDGVIGLKSDRLSEFMFCAPCVDDIHKTTPLNEAEAVES